MQNVKTHLFSYNYEGSLYSLEIPANSVEEARGRLSMMPFAKYDGELVAIVPALPSVGVFVRLFAAIRNFLRT